jgi:hypothetical protein
LKSWEAFLADWHLGQHVVCVDSFETMARLANIEAFPQKGVVYTLRAIDDFGFGVEHLAFLLEEIRNPVGGRTIDFGIVTLVVDMPEQRFCSCHFRPVKETNIDVFKEILEKLPTDAEAGQDA